MLRERLVVTVGRCVEREVDTEELRDEREEETDLLLEERLRAVLTREDLLELVLTRPEDCLLDELVDFELLDLLRELLLLRD